MTKKTKSKDKEKSIRLDIHMPRVVAKDATPEAVADVKDLMELLAQSCAFIISINKDAQVCMDMINHIGKSDRYLEIAFNHGLHDVDHFRTLVGTIATAYEEVMNGYQIKLVEPLDFSSLESDSA